MMAYLCYQWAGHSWSLTCNLLGLISNDLPKFKTILLAVRLQWLKIDFRKLKCPPTHRMSLLFQTNIPQMTALQIYTPHKDADDVICKYRDQELSIETSLSKLFNCMKLAYRWVASRFPQIPQSPNNVTLFILLFPLPDKSWPRPNGTASKEFDYGGAPRSD